MEIDMGKGIYSYYKERLIEIGGKSKCLYLKSIIRRGAYDIGRIFEGRDDKVSELMDFLWNGSRQPLTLITKGDAKEIVSNVGHSASIPKGGPETVGMTVKEAEEAWEKYNKAIARDAVKTVENEVARIRELKREVEDIEKETGRYELYIGYPFVFGSINQGAAKTLIKAPLLLFPVRIEISDDDTVEIKRNEAEKIQINRALIYAYAQSKKLDIEQLELDFDDLSRFKNVKAITDYLAAAKIKIECTASKTVYTYSRFKEPEDKGELSIRYGAVLARLSLSNSIYNDYNELEKKKLSNDAIIELLHSGSKRAIKLSREKAKLIAKRSKRKKHSSKKTYAVKMLDFSQSEVVRQVDENGNMVIYGPPGTGKSQTIVNIITDAICKHKRVLVVSQKKAALDVVYSRLGTLGEKAMYINDESKEKKSFYERVLAAHQKDENEALCDVDALNREYDELQARIDAEEANLNAIEKTLTSKRAFGLSLSEMYSSSYMIAKNTVEYSIYLRMIEDKGLMKLGYKALSDALFAIRAESLAELYYRFVESKEKNPIIEYMLPDLDIRTLSEVKGMLEEAQKKRKGYFNISKYPYTRQVLAHYALLDDPESLEAIVRLEARLESNKLFGKKKRRAAVERGFRETVTAVREFVKEYDCLTRVMTKDGYISVIDNILRGNNGYLKLVYEALDNYISTRDVSNLLASLNQNMLTVLNFAYSACKNYSSYTEILEKLILIRIYHEITVLEDECKDELARVVDFPNITAKIYKLKEAQLSVAFKLCAGKTSTDYRKMYDAAKNGKDYLYQISKKQKYWPIRKTMEQFGEFIITLFPCWLLSPENVSTLLPLTKNLFDIVIFDEASQIFIESTIPTIYRGKNIVVAGDAKQLRPSATFMKRYLGADPEVQEDLSVQAALEVESLLDLAVARYSSANLTYHYRSRNEELISFSNNAFYSSGLQIAPNISPNKHSRPIARHKVDGRWVNRTNPAEAEKIVELLRDLLANRKNNESIGIITFNSEQQGCIADAIDKVARTDADFRARITKEAYRLDNGEDTSLFIKNLENVQGDERDIIIFSIGYAPGENGRLHANFGSLSAEGGENRLNVAITRAKTHIIVVTSIEPEDLKVEDTKNLGPKLLKEYLRYVRAVSAGDDGEAEAVLNGLMLGEAKKDDAITNVSPIECQIKERLEKAGYAVKLGLGSSGSKLSLAIYDEKSDKFLVGVELDKDAFASGECSMERDVYKPKFLEARGWTVLRVWCRDWWLSPSKVIKTITAAAEKNRA